MKGYAKSKAAEYYNCTLGSYYSFISNNFSDILIAGEPTIMGGLTDDDERPITRIENIEGGENVSLENNLHDPIKAERD